MNESEIYGGIKVLISDNPIYTAKTHTMIPAMTKMTGKEYIINRSVLSKYGLAADINRFWWHPKDLTIVKPIIKKPEIHYFDTKELIT